MRGSAGWSALACLMAAFACVETGLAQTTVRLETADVVYRRDFTDLRALRPLSNGAVVAVEGAGGEVILLAPDGNGEEAIGRRGQGPNEYMQPADALPIGDSDFTLLVDSGLQRLLIVSPDGQVLGLEEWRVPTEAVPGARDGSEGQYYDVAGAVRMDRNGQVIEGPAPLVRVGPDGLADTLTLVTVYELAERWSQSPVSRMFSPGPGGVALFRLDRSPFAAQDEWALMSDGSVAVARARPYRVDVIRSSGEVLVGAEVGYDPVPVRSPDREAFLAHLTRGKQAGGMSFSTTDGGTVPMAGPQGGPPDLTFPEEKAPFLFGGLHVTSAEILVQRHVAHDAGFSHIDVFDKTGRQTSQIRLPQGRTLVAATTDHLYAIAYDEFDLQRVERYLR